MELGNTITLEKIVNQMMEESNHNPRDYCFKFIVNNYPGPVHDAFDFPGEYADSLKLEVYTEDGRKLEMDCAQLVMPKGDITCKSTINVEHHTYPIKEKVRSIYDYKLYLIHKTNIPSNSIVMTNIDPGKEEICCESHDQLFKLKINVVNAEKISKRLIILMNKIRNKNRLSQNEAMYFAYIAIFLRRENSKETMEILCKLFSQINQIEPNLELDLHQILKKMIKFHFKDDENKIKELLTMISKSIFQRNLEGLTYKERTQIQMDEKDAKLAENAIELEEKDVKLAENAIELEEKENENKKLKREIEMLKKQING